MADGLDAAANGRSMLMAENSEMLSDVEGLQTNDFGTCIKEMVKFKVRGL